MNTRELFGIFAKGLNINKKEVKRMSRPYLEVKVVKVKGKEKDAWVGGVDVENKSYKIIRSKKGNHYLEEFDKPKKGTWVNGENLDKIKFPAPCRYGGGMLGMITRTKANESMDEDFYTLHDIGKQHSSYSSVRSYYNFRDLIEVWDIHILKAKIILFEEKNK